MSTPIWKRGETKEKLLTCVIDGELRDLSTASAVEYQVKAIPGGDDPPLIGLAVGTGITLRTQSGATLGQADIVITSTMTDALAPGVYYEEATVVYPAPTGRKVLVGPRKFIMEAVVNRP